MEFVHDRNSNIIFSLHDSRIQKVDFQNNTLILKMNRIFQYTADGENIFPETLSSRTATWTNAVFLFLIKLFMKGNFQEMPSV